MPSRRLRLYPQRVALSTLRSFPARSVDTQSQGHKDFTLDTLRNPRRHSKQCVSVRVCVCVRLCMRALIVKNQIKLIGLDWYRRQLCLL